MIKWFLALFPLIVGADQYTKWLVRQHIELNERVVVFDGFFNLTHVQNPGAAFGLFRDLDPAIRNPLFYGVSFIAFAILLYLFKNTSVKDWRIRGILIIIAGGALGNIIDRVLFGQVTDFIQVYYKQYYWPSFNIADSCISVGVTLLVIEMLFFNQQLFEKEGGPEEVQTLSDET